MGTIFKTSILDRTRTTPNPGPWKIFGHTVRPLLTAAQTGGSVLIAEIDIEAERHQG